ncbi:MAG TPA: hypothetical protein VNO21_01750, partial [Polyangiaceae bacterium]|nr:hypothetical protein [Polyangiaceae bacterium]
TLPVPVPVPEAVIAKEEIGSGSGSGEKDEEKEEKAKKNGRPWWHWALLALLIVAVVLLVLWLLRSCGREHEAGLGITSDAGDGAVLARAPGDLSGADGSAIAAADGAAPANGVGDAGAGTQSDMAHDAGAADNDIDTADIRLDGGGTLPDGGKRMIRIKGKWVVVPVGPGGGPGVGAGGGAGAPGAGAGGGEKELPHRSHFQPDAVRWRVTGGLDQLDPHSPHTGEGSTFDVVLRPGGSFGSVKVQWQDKSGRWHN